jgi:hypothetical protein
MATHNAQVEWLPSRTAAGYFVVGYVPMYVPTANVNLNYIAILYQSQIATNRTFGRGMK